jgi:hypothetical protein
MLLFHLLSTWLLFCVSFNEVQWSLYVNNQCLKHIIFSPKKQRHRKQNWELHAFTIFSLNYTSLVLFSLLIPTAEWCPLSIHNDSTYMRGEKWQKGIPTTYMNKSAKMCFIKTDEFIALTTRFIQEKPVHTHSNKLLHTVKAFFKLTKFSGTIFQLQYSQNPWNDSLSFCCSLFAKICLPSLRTLVL